MISRLFDAETVIVGMRPVVAIKLTGLNVTPPRAAALLHKEELTRERLVFTIRQVCQAVR